MESVHSPVQVRFEVRYNLANESIWPNFIIRMMKSFKKNSADVVCLKLGGLEQEAQIGELGILVFFFRSEPIEPA